MQAGEPAEGTDAQACDPAEGTDVQACEPAEVQACEPAECDPTEGTDVQACDPAEGTGTCAQAHEPAGKLCSSGVAWYCAVVWFSRSIK